MMTQERFKKIMAISKNVCVVFFWACLLSSMCLGFFVFPKEPLYQFFIILMWVIGIAPYISHYFFVPFFIEKILKIKIVSGDLND
jgi:hypothetical protein